MDAEVGTAPLSVDRRATLEQLRAFAAVVDGGGFLAASATLGRTQSAVTQSLKKLEDVLGCRLIDRRQGHVLGPTPAGLRLLPQAREILARVTLAVETLRRPSLAGRVRVGVPDDMRAGDIQAALAGTLAANADLSVAVRSGLSGDIAALYARDALDVALFRKPTEAPVVGTGRLRTLRRERLTWVGAQAGDFHGSGPLPLVLYAEGCAYRSVVLTILAAQGRAAEIVYSTYTLENLQGAVRAGLGIAVVPAGTLFDGAVALGPRQGLPSLPDIDLVLAVRDAEGPHRALAADLVTACGLRGPGSAGPA